MVVLYHSTGTRSQRVRWVLEEMDLEYQLKLVHFPPRVRQPDYLIINPVGTLPTLDDGELRLTESMAICQYLTATYGPTALVVDATETSYATYLQYCWYGEATLMGPVGALVRQTLLAPEGGGSKEAIESARQALSLRFRPIEHALAGANYLAADRLTLADVSVAYSIGLVSALGFKSDIPLVLLDYHSRLAERPAYRRAHDLSPLP